LPNCLRHIVAWTELDESKTFGLTAEFVGYDARRDWLVAPVSKQLKQTVISDAVPEISNIELCHVFSLFVEVNLRSSQAGTLLYRNAGATVRAWRPAALQDLGLWRATDIVGGFHAWRATGLPTVPPSKVSWGDPILTLIRLATNIVLVI
jgi:hypothetical protein